MDTRFLQSFVTVVEQGSIAEGARRLNLTAAAVAQRIRALESEIGVRLLSRSGQTVQPTEAGAAILARARDLLGQVRDLRSLAAGDIPSGELRLGAIQTAKSGLLPQILSVMTKSYPQIEIRIAGNTAAPLYAQVLNGELDAGNYHQAAIPHSQGLRMAPVAGRAADCACPQIVIDPRSTCSALL